MALLSEPIQTEFEALDQSSERSLALSVKSDFRKALRTTRRALSAREQKAASMSLCQRLAQLPDFVYGKRIAAYIPCDGEIDPQPLLELAWRLKKQVFLPVLHPFQTGCLLFLEHTPHQPLAKNRFGIPEPLSHKSEHCPAWMLDMVLTPLVGFDEMGNRMGMGGGFYDRTFAFLQIGGRPRAPQMVGVAHDCQKLESVPTDRWDIPMKHIVTDQAIYQASTPPSSR